MFRVRAIAFTILTLCFFTHVEAQIILEDDMTTGDNWTTIDETDTLATFGYDYAAGVDGILDTEDDDAIPEAPNTPMGATARTGLKMEANLTTGALHEIAVVPTDIDLSGQYRIQVDIWGNYEVGGGPTTEFMGVFAGHDGVTAGRDGAGLLYTGDGGSTFDYRLYKGGGPASTSGQQFIESGQYSFDFGDLPCENGAPLDPLEPCSGGPEPANNGAHPFLASQFPAFDVGLALEPIDGQGGCGTQCGITDDGDAGFQWMTLEVIVDSNGVGLASDLSCDPGDPVNTCSTLGTAEFRLTSHEVEDPVGGGSLHPGNTVWIGTVDNTNEGAKVAMTGAPALVYADLFSSLATAPQWQFGIFDNFLIEQLVSDELLGDYDDSGAVGAGDLGLVLGTWGGNMIPPEWVNQIPDGNVGAAELGVVLAEWGNTAPPPSVPEPTCLGLLALVGFVGFARRRS